jgi:hypothetical protein
MNLQCEGVSGVLDNGDHIVHSSSAGLSLYIPIES